MRRVSKPPGTLIAGQVLASVAMAAIQRMPAKLAVELPSTGHGSLPMAAMGVLQAAEMLFSLLC